MPQLSGTPATARGWQRERARAEAPAEGREEGAGRVAEMVFRAVSPALWSSQRPPGRSQQLTTSPGLGRDRRLVPQTMVLCRSRWCWSTSCCASRRRDAKSGSVRPSASSSTYRIHRRLSSPCSQSARRSVCEFALAQRPAGERAATAAPPPRSRGAPRGATRGATRGAPRGATRGAKRRFCRGHKKSAALPPEKRGAPLKKRGAPLREGDAAALPRRFAGLSRRSAAVARRYPPGRRVERGAMSDSW